MFFANFILSKNGSLSKIWLAAHMDKKLTRCQVFETNINSSVADILDAKVKFALRTKGHLLLGVVRLHSRQAKYLLFDCNQAFMKLKSTFNPNDNTEVFTSINLVEDEMNFKNIYLEDLDPIRIAAHQCRIQDITIQDDNYVPNLGRPDDDFGDSIFETGTSNLISNDVVYEELQNSVVSVHVEYDADDNDYYDNYSGGDNFTYSSENQENLFQDTVAADSVSVSGIESSYNDKTRNEETIVNASELPTLAEEESDTVMSDTIEEMTGTPLHNLPDFALPSVEQSFKQTRRPLKRKRMFLVDEKICINSKIMQKRMLSTSDITRPFELAPPTKKIMFWKQTGNVDALFTNPGRPIYSKTLKKLFYRNLKTVPVPNDSSNGLPFIRGLRRRGGFYNWDQDFDDTVSETRNTPDPYRSVKHGLNLIQEDAETNSLCVEDNNNHGSVGYENYNVSFGCDNFGSPGNYSNADLYNQSIEKGRKFDNHSTDNKLLDTTLDGSLNKTITDDNQKTPISLGHNSENFSNLEQSAKRKRIPSNDKKSECDILNPTLDNSLHSDASSDASVERFNKNMQSFTTWGNYLMKTKDIPAKRPRISSNEENVHPDISFHSLNNSERFDQSIEKARKLNNENSFGKSILSDISNGSFNINENNFDRQSMNSYYGDENIVPRKTATALIGLANDITEDVSPKESKQKCDTLLRNLEESKNHEFKVDFQELMKGKNKRQVVSDFYSLLKLGKDKKVKLNQENPLSNIIISIIR